MAIPIDKLLKNLAAYSAMKEVDKMTDDQRLEFVHKFEEDLKKDPELREMFNASRKKGSFKHPNVVKKCINGA